LREQSLRLPSSRTVLPLLCFVGSGLLSLLAGTVYWDPAVPRSDNLILVQLAQWAIFVFSALIFLLAGELGRQTRWLAYATWTFLALAGVVMLEPYFPWLHRALMWNDPTRAKSAMLFAWIGALTMGQLLFNRRLQALAKLALFTIWAITAYAVWVLWTEWTSGLAPFTVATVAVIWLRVWRHNRSAALAATLALAVLAVVSAPFLFTISGGERELENSWGARLLVYRAVLDMAKAHPILGLGPAAYRHYGWNRMISLGVGRALYTRPNISSHNNYIDIYAQVGLLGLGLFVWFLIEVGVLGWRLVSRFRWDFRDGYVQAALGGLAGCVVAMMLVDWFLPYVYNVSFYGFRTSALAWMFLGGLVALEQAAKE
jgi:O-antigen ligase